MRYRMTIEYEADNLQDAVAQADRAMDEVNLMDHKLERAVSDGSSEGHPEWEEVEN